MTQDYRFDKYTPFTGVVEDREDPLQIGRVRVRCFGYHSANKTDIPTSDLPWATVLLPTTSPGTSGLGASPHFLVEGSWVHGFFRDGPNAQDPVITAVYSTQSSEEPLDPSQSGFTDPTGTYPRENGESDTNKLARGINTIQYNPAPQIGEPASQYKAQYPLNHVFESESGHIVEVDDTSGGERIRVYHRSGSFVEFHPNGDVVTRQGNKYEVVINDDKCLVQGKVNLIVNSDVNWYVGGNIDITAAGNINLSSGGSINISAASSINETAGTINMNSGSAAFSAQNQSLVLKLAGANAAFDDNLDGSVPTDLIVQAEDINGGNDVVLSNNEDVKKEDIKPRVDSCLAINEQNLDLTYNISPNYTIKNLTIDPIFPHPIAAQHGFTLGEIVCNMEGLAKQILEPLAAKYPGFRINSGFRTFTGSSSQHERGMAVDIQWPGLTNQEYYDRALWVKANLPFDQFIFEHGNSIWFHLSYNRNREIQRNQSLTYYKSKYFAGTTLYYA